VVELSAGVEVEVAPGAGVEFTAEQLDAIDRRGGDLLLDASAGSGKTSVLVERFVRAVLDDGIAVDSILTITFTEKAAAEMRDRIRLCLRDRGHDDAARATEGAFISTIHGFCARLLRAHALAAGIDPAFVVLDRPQSQRLADAAFDEALEELAQSAPGAVELIAAHTAAALRASILATYGELRSRGQMQPALPSLAPAPDLAPLRKELQRAAAVAADELGAHGDPPARVVEALGRVERCAGVLAAAEPWPGELEALALPGGNGAALTSDACVVYGEALARFRDACAHLRAADVHRLLGQLLQGYGRRYEQRKHDCSGLDFEDLELMTRELLHHDSELCERYRSRFEQIMVDELQDTNQVQLELIESIARENLFTVGDAQQSIYGFRHADVALFERRSVRLARAGARATLRTNFRSRREIIDVLNAAFARELGEQYAPPIAGRADPPATDPRVELIVVDKAGEWSSEELAAPWRLGEARALAQRVRELIDAGTRPHEVVVLFRATTDLRTYERALEDREIPTYVIGGRGYWSHPQITDLICYLRALANPRDEQALYAVLVSPMVGASVDALVVLAAAARESGRGPWAVLRDPDGALDGLAEKDQERLRTFASWLERERRAVPHTATERLIDRALELAGYELAVLSLPGGQRRLANLRKLMRLAREHEAAAGRDLRAFLDLVSRRASVVGPTDAHESEAPVEGEALDAVRLMTIHRAKGLEFPVVCVADLGREPYRSTELMRVGRDGRFGVRLAEPGTGKRDPALDYKALGEEAVQAQAREERRLLYVAMTRAKERLVVSGAAKLDRLPQNGAPMVWLGPALIPDVAERVDQRCGAVDGVKFTILGAQDLQQQAPARPAPPPAPVPRRPQPSAAAASTGHPRPAVSTVSYSSLGEYERCGYRFYVERVLGLPPAPVLAAHSAGALNATEQLGATERLTATDRGILVHALLEKLDFRRPRAPQPASIMAASEQELTADDAAEVAALLDAFAGSGICRRLGNATAVRREQRFRFPLGELLVAGVIDVIAKERDQRMLVVDYKTDRLEGANPKEVAAAAYATQRTVYALAALRAGAKEVEVVHVFLELPERPVTASFTRADAPRLQSELGTLTRGLLAGEFTVTDTPHRGLCSGCPAEGGLCSWPLEVTRRAAADRLF
jgi:ATP-dependent exoDNAse (exonuclease V) beta subunit